jgi:tRNA nucleotidyltransferase (CCA-adding enzyme)
MNASLEVRFAALCHDLGKGSTHPEALPRHIGHEGRSVKLLRGVCERLRVPQTCKELAEVVAREHCHIHGCLGLSAEAVLRLLVRCDALRRPERFALALQACQADARDSRRCPVPCPLPSAAGDAVSGPGAPLVR